MQYAMELCYSRHNNSYSTTECFMKFNKQCDTCQMDHIQDLRSTRQAESDAATIVHTSYLIVAYNTKQRDINARYILDRVHSQQVIIPEIPQEEKIISIDSPDVWSNLGEARSWLISNQYTSIIIIKQENQRFVVIVDLTSLWEAPSEKLFSISRSVLSLVSGRYL